MILVQVDTAKAKIAAERARLEIGRRRRARFVGVLRAAHATQWHFCLAWLPQWLQWIRPRLKTVREIGERCRDAYRNGLSSPSTCPYAAAADLLCASERVCNEVLWAAKSTECPTITLDEEALQVLCNLKGQQDANE